MKAKLRIRLEIKEITAEGSFEGMLSPYGNVDGGGDVVVPGAYTKTLKDRGNKIPLLWQHKSDVPVGDLTLEDRPEGLWCKGQLLMALPEAQKAYLLIKARIVKGLSIGFEAIKDAIEGGIRHLKEIKLYEGSIVTFPMNEQALIASVKAALEAKGDFNEELTEIQVLDADYQMFCALRHALGSIVWSDTSREEKISAAQVINQQFADAHAAWFPLYLDALAKMYGGIETWSAKRLEKKAGARFSAATRSEVQSVIEKLSALIAEEAVTSDEADTSKAKAAPKSEPAPDHSAIQNLIHEIKGALHGNARN